MDIEITNVLWGFLTVIVARKAWNMFIKEENKTRELMGKPVEMRDVDPTTLGGPLYYAVGPYAYQ
jgi:hypothetical protein